MKPKELEEIIHQNPFHPFRLVTADGEELTVNKPRKAHVSGPYVSLHGISRRRNGVGREGLRIVPTDQIVSAAVLR